MASLRGLFGKSRAEAKPAVTTPPISEPQPVAASEKLHETESLLEKREAHVLRLIEGEVEAARMHTLGNRKRDALECIKRKRLHEKELERLSVQRLNLMQTNSQLAQLRINSIVIEAEQVGAAAIEREIKKHGGIEGIEKVKDRLEDALADCGDVLEAGNRVMGEAANLDDQELLDEIEALELEQEIMTTNVGGAAGSASSSGAAASSSSAEAPRFAEVPDTVPSVQARQAAAAARRAAQEEEDERELAQLAAKMGVEQAMPMPMAACSMAPPVELAQLAAEMKLEQAMPMPMMAMAPPVPMMAACH